SQRISSRVGPLSSCHASSAWSGGCSLASFGGLVTVEFAKTEWAIILGGSSGFGLATARKLAAHGMSLAIVHRDRRGAMERIESEFERIRESGALIVAMNADALDRATRGRILAELSETMGPEGRVRVLLHSIAFGNLKLVAPERQPARPELAALAT